MEEETRRSRTTQSANTYTNNTQKDDSKQQQEQNVVVGTISSRSFLSKKYGTTGSGSAHLVNPTTTTTTTADLVSSSQEEEEEEHDNDAFGFVNGDFLSGKIRNVHVSRAFVISFSPSNCGGGGGAILAVGLHNGVALYETRTFSLIYTIERNDTVSSLQWLLLPSSCPSSSCPSSSSLLLFLAAGGLDGVVTLYQMDLNLIELQGVSILHEFSVSSQHQVRTMTLNHCHQYQQYHQDQYHCRRQSNNDSRQLLLLWMVGDTSGTISVQCVLLSLFQQDAATITTTTARTMKLMEYRHESAILGLAVNRSTTLVAISTKSGKVTVQRIHYEYLNNDDNDENDTFSISVSLGGGSDNGNDDNVYNVIRNGPVRSIVFTTQDEQQRLVCGGYDKTVVIVDTTLWAIIRELRVNGTINTLSLDDTERYLAVGARDKTLTLYDTSSWCPIKTIHTPKWVTSISWTTTNNNNIIVAVRTEPTCISILDLTPIHVITDMHMSSSTTTTTTGREDSEYCWQSWTTNGYFVARTVGTKVVVADARQQFGDVTSIDTGGYVRCVQFCPTSNCLLPRLAVVNSSGYLFVLQLAVVDDDDDNNSQKYTLQILHSMFIEEDLWVIAWSCDGKLLATGGKGKLLYILSTTNYKRMRDPMKLAGRIWGIDFIPNGVIAALGGGEKKSGAAMAVGTGDYVATIYDANTFQPILRVIRDRTVRCVKYHPCRPLLAVGDGGNSVVIVDFVEEDLVNEFRVGGRVNCLEFSPQGDFLVVGSDDCRFTMHETASYRAVQEIRTPGFAKSAAFSPSGEWMTLGCANGDYSIVRLGPLLAIDLVPLSPATDFSNLPSWALNEVLYRSGDGPSLVQRFMIEGSPETLQQAAQILKHNPDAMYTFDRKSEEGCFDTVLSLQKPNLLKLTLITLVDGTLEAETSNGGKRSILTTDFPERGAEALYDMIFNQPPQLIVDILNAMSFIKVPFTHPHPFHAKDHNEMGSTSYTDPWELDVNDVSLKAKRTMYRTPAVLPLPGLGSSKFLSAFIDKVPPSVFDNDAMGLVLRIMWRDHIRFYFLMDVFLFVVFYGLWIVYVDCIASTTDASSGITSTKGAIAIVLLVMNSGFGLKEIYQSETFRRLAYFKSPWNLVDLTSILLVYAYVLSTLLRDGDGSRLVPLVVFATFFVTLKLVAYLRGFGDTGWLVSVLRANFYDVRGFAIVLACCLFGFALVFRVLYGDIPGACAGTECEVDPFGSYGRSLLSTFELAVLGVYDPAILSDSQFQILSALCFILAVICVLVVALNALIAVLGDSYARVQENATANRRRERAELIFEYLCIVSRKRRQSIEKKTKYFHALLESDDDGDLLVNQNDWQGGLNALRRDLQEDQEETMEANQRAMEQLRIELNSNMAAFQKQMTLMLEDLSDDIQGIKKAQARSGVGKNVASVVKNIGKIGRSTGHEATKID